MQPQNHGSSLKQIVNRNCKVLSSNQEKPCNLKPAQNRKINSRSAAYAFFTGDLVRSEPEEDAVLDASGAFSFSTSRPRRWIGNLEKLLAKILAGE